MHAGDTTIKKFLEGSKQFTVPLFQRTYSWKLENIEQLWEDLQNTRNGGGEEGDKNTHFFGSFVTMPSPSSASQASKYVIIDGQQRLVTTCILLAALRNRMSEISPHDSRNGEINDLYLINKYQKEEKYKILPTQVDRPIFAEIIDEPKPDTSKQHLMMGTYSFFQSQLSEISDLKDITEIKEAILSKFSVVDIRLEERDDPYLIFESLNAKGVPLTQSDLIRNYLFMRIKNVKTAESVYQKLWLPMQENLEDRLEQFMRHYLAMDGDIPNVKKVYADFRDRGDKTAKTEDNVIEMMKDLSKFSVYYDRFLHPEKEKEDALKESFERFVRLGQSTPYPLFLKLYDDYQNATLSSNGFADCLKAVETYIVRRAVCSISAQALNLFFPTIYDSLDKNNLADSLKEKLRTSVKARRMPDDAEFRRHLIEEDLYGDRVIRYVLEEIEKRENKEPVKFEDLQVEHIMPQTLDDEWKKMLGEDWELTYKKYVDTLGNLTLTGYNQEYWNYPFRKKRDMKNGYKESNLRLNRDLAELDNWTEGEIGKRAERLSELALEIWHVRDIGIPERKSAPETEQTGRAASSEEDRLKCADSPVREAYESIKAALLKANSGLKINPTKSYISIVHKKTIAYFDIRKKEIRLVVMLPKTEVKDKVSKHHIRQLSERRQKFYGGPSCEVLIENADDVQDVIDLLKPLVIESTCNSTS